ncbi:helix-turn-helix domain-containing protein [Paenibacillus senegalensis]|uniref:helix-turn-helix domain-containing protein n=1 Tax=Paenibacillus senegalensis TaxID=1465766 RepID=UPI000289C0EE|nr:helix-turn-helix transcriptional regulator [Paenibacillus senegalensis]
MKTWDEFEKEISSVDDIEMETIKQKAWMVSAIIRQRRMLGWTQEQVAQRAGLSQSMVARLENSTQIPRYDTLQKVVLALGLRFELEEIRNQLG